MKHLYLPFPCDDKDEIALEGPDFHYLTHVLRFRKGTTFKGIDASGQQYFLEVKNITKDSALLSVKPGVRLYPELPPIALFQALPKGKVMDRIIRQATETGISRIIPVITSRAIVQAKSTKSIDNRLERWSRIIKGALQQSEGVILPYVSPPLNMPEAIKLAKGLKLFFHQDKKENKPLHECLADKSLADKSLADKSLADKSLADKSLADKIDEIDIFIGPEGGFSDSEYNLLKKSGFIPINLGNTVLRVDTAAIFALAALKILLLEKEKWRRV